MRGLAFAAAAICLLAGPAFGDPADWAGLTKFAGTYPADGLMKSALVRGEVAALLNTKQQALLTAMAVSPPVSGVGGDLLAQFCMPHDCGSESAMLVVDPAGQRIWVGFYKNDGKRFETDWVGSDDPADIPAEVLEAVAKVHSPF